VNASYSCQDGSGGTGIRSCAGPVASGSPIDTSTTGTHSFTVTATSQDGESTSQTVSYTVVPGSPDNHFTLTRVKSRGDGSIAFAVTVPGPGRIDVLETAGRSLVGSHAALLAPGPGRFALVRSHTSIGGGTKQMRVTPSAHLSSVIARWRRQHRAVTINLWVTYTPTGGSPRNVGKLGVLLIR
jgi:hypothetical protein